MRKIIFPEHEVKNRYNDAIVKRSRGYENLVKKSLNYDWYDVLPFSLGLWNAIYAECASSGDWQSSHANTSSFVIEYIIDGSVEIVSNDQMRVLTPGNLFVSCPGTSSIKRNHPGCSCRNIQIVIMGGMSRIIPEILGITRHAFFVFSNEKYHQEFLAIARRIKEILRDKDPAFARENAELAYRLVLLLAEMVSQQHDKELPEIITNAVSMMKNTSDTCNSISNLAARLNVSRATITRLFQKHLNVSPGVYWNNIKMETAKTMLSNSSKSIKEIAEILNFENQFYFSTVFKRETGVSPREFRKRSTTAK